MAAVSPAALAGPCRARRRVYRVLVRAHEGMTLVHNLSISERTWADELVAHAHCDCGWTGPSRSQANANLLAQQDAWDHIERVQRTIDADRLVPAA